MSSIVENLKEIAGSLPEGVKLVAVSKTKPVEAIEEAYEAGQRVFGENRENKEETGIGGEVRDTSQRYRMAYDRSFTN